MKYLLDTMVISGLRQRPMNKNLEHWYTGLPEDSFFLSVITIGEIQKGICLLKKREKTASGLETMAFTGNNRICG